MSQPYVGEIRIFAGNFAPAGWMFCEGQLLAIADNDVLFQLIGTTYGGDGQATFALPDLRGRIPLHQGTGYQMGQNGGSESVTLSVQQIPAHTHPVNASSDAGDSSQPQNNVPATNAAVQIYRAQAPVTPMAVQAISSTGGSQPHSNFQPYLCVDFIISLFGVFPSPT